MVPCVYFFYPETAYRSLEEMDEIFQSVSGFKGAFDVVKVAHDLPRRYGKRGELIIRYDETEAARELERRRSSIVSPPRDTEKDTNGVDKLEHVNGNSE